jgi:hypothetical protein
VIIYPTINENKPISRFVCSIHNKLLIDFYFICILIVLKDCKINTPKSSKNGVGKILLAFEY